MEITCEDLSNSIVQLGIILYPPDMFHEKFLLKMRECSQNLKDEHPVKQWLKWISAAKQAPKDEQEMMSFLSEILNSKFNLITEVKVKKRIIEVLTSIPGDDLAEEILQSYLYLMIGNVSRSDNILRKIINRPPYESWKGFSTNTSIYHRVVRDNLSQLFSKLSKHPSDRKTFELFSKYLQEFYNDVILLERLSEYELNALDGKWAYGVVTRIAPDLSRYIRLSRLNDQKMNARLKRGGFSDEFLAYWVWYFFPVGPLISESSLKVINMVEQKDPLWLIYLLESEKLADLYISKKEGKNHVSHIRSVLRSSLQDKELFMLVLYKLIELGDIDEKLVQETLDFLIHE